MRIAQNYEAAIVAELKKIRAENGWSYDYIASRAGLHRTAISLIERGERHMTLLVFLKICLAMTVDPAGIFLAAAQAVEQTQAPQISADPLANKTAAIPATLHSPKRSLKAED